MLHDVSLADRFDLSKETVLLGGIPALVRALLTFLGLEHNALSAPIPVENLTYTKVLSESRTKKAFESRKTCGRSGALRRARIRSRKRAWGARERTRCPVYMNVLRKVLALLNVPAHDVAIAGLYTQAFGD